MHYLDGPLFYSILFMMSFLVELISEWGRKLFYGSWESATLFLIVNF